MGRDVGAPRAPRLPLPAAEMPMVEAALRAAGVALAREA
jgi:4-hydroxy-tetrahydrodipicolinate synthase